MIHNYLRLIALYSTKIGSHDAYRECRQMSIHCDYSSATPTRDYITNYHMQSGVTEMKDKAEFR